MSILQLIAQGNFITYNKEIAKKFGVNSAILLGAMCSYQVSFDGNEFYKEQYKIAEDTALSEYEIKKALKVLKDNGIVNVKRKGVPSQNYYFVNADKLGDILLTSELKFNRLESQNLTDYITNNTITNNTNNNKEKDIKKKTFVAPTFEEVKEYAKNRNRLDLAQKFYDYYTAGNWIDAKGNKVKNWKQKFITWENNNKKEVLKQDKEEFDLSGTGIKFL